MTTVKCPSCGQPLTEAHRIGRTLCCPACRCQFLYQDGTVILPDARYLKPEQSWEQVLKKCFEPIIANSDVKASKDVVIKDCRETYEPFVEIVNRTTDTKIEHLYKAIGKSCPISVITDIDHVTSSPEIRLQDIPSQEVGLYDDSVLLDLKDKCDYVSETIVYIPIKSICFSIGQNYYVCVAYGDTIRFTEGNFQLMSQEKSEVSLPLWYKILSGLFLILIIIGAWYKFCYTYYHFHGLDLIIMAAGYKCLLPFLGVSIMAVIGFNITNLAILQGIEQTDTNGETKTQRAIIETLHKKCRV